MSAVKHLPEGNDSDRDYRDVSARASDAVREVPKIGVLVVSLFHDLEGDISMNTARTGTKTTPH